MKVGPRQPYSPIHETWILTTIGMIKRGFFHSAEK